MHGVLVTALRTAGIVMRLEKEGKHGNWDPPIVTMTLNTKYENKINASRQRLSNAIFIGVKNSSPTCLFIRQGHKGHISRRVAHRVVAVAAQGGSRRVIKVPGKSIDKVPRPFLTCLVRREVEDIELVGSTPDDQTVELGRQHRRKRPRIWYQLV